MERLRKIGDGVVREVDKSPGLERNNVLSCGLAIVWPENLDIEYVEGKKVLGRRAP